MIRSRPAVLVSACWLSGCAPSTPPPSTEVTALVGEVTIHEFTDWTHAWAAFVAGGIPTSVLGYDSIFQLPAGASVQKGPCEIIVGPVCSVPCGAQAFCLKDDLCVPWPDRSYLDAGPIDVHGGLGTLTPMRLGYDAASGLYDSTPAPGTGLLFTGGEPLDIGYPGGSDLPAAHTTLRAPQRIELSAPPLDPFHVPTSGPLPFVWQPGDAELIEILLVGSSNTDATRWTSVRCLAADTGSYDLPAEVLATLPPPPRTVHLEVTRNAEQVVPAAGTSGVLIHAGHTAAANGTDP